MSTDAAMVAEFYATQRGLVAGGLVRERLRAVWPSLDGMSVLGIGYAAPYVRLWTGSARRCIIAIPAQLEPAQIGLIRWPTISGNLTCTTVEDALPFPDLSFDRVLLVHGLEAADDARAMLREVWRVLRDDGRLLVVAPNRRGLWAHMESTPFGHGQPYSPGQIGRLLAQSMFRVERRDQALFLPPISARLVLRSARVWEDGGRYLAPHLAGVTITEAVKDVYAAIPVKRALRRMVLSQAA
jgi:SAM-dependent methyltransferase